MTKQDYNTEVDYNKIIQTSITIKKNSEVEL